MVGRIPTGVTENWPTSVAKAIRRKESADVITIALQNCLYNAS